MEMLLNSRGCWAGIYLLRMDLSSDKDSINMLDSKENSNKSIGNWYRVIYL